LNILIGNGSHSSKTGDTGDQEIRRSEGLLISCSKPTELKFQKIGR
jgi:hypothetical protein